MDKKDLFTKQENMPETEFLPKDTKYDLYDGEGVLVAMLGKGARESQLEELGEDLPALREKLGFLDPEKYRYVLMIWREHEEVRALFFSEDSHVRALEFLNAVFSDAALVKGDSFKALAKVSTAILWVRMEEAGLADLADYFREKVVEYFQDCDSVIAGEYGKRHLEDIKRMSKFRKRHITWSYVRSTDVVEEGQLFRLRTLENESGSEIAAAQDLYIMIGTQGEVYHIARSKFEASYEASEEPLDIFSQMTVFLPEIEVVSTGEYIDIDEVAHICYPRRDAGIYAKELERRTKVYPVYDPDKYFLGKKGDFMAIRMDDPTDIYIIQRNIFHRTYEVDEEAETGSAR